MSETLNKRKELTGKVVSNKMTKSAIVEVSRRIKHPLYKKFITVKKRYSVHDESNKCKVGENVTIRSVRPISKTKNWAIVGNALPQKG